MRLKKFEVTNGGKFNPDAPIVIDFSRSKLVQASGDQGCGKTTLVELLLMACGQLGGDEVVKSLVNVDTGKLDVNLTFTGNDRAEYEVSVTKSQFNLTRDGEKQSTPKELLKKLLGQVGVSPIDIKNGDIDEIVKWLAQYSTRPSEDFVKDLRRINDGIKVAAKGRADANKEAKAIRTLFINSGVMNEDGELNEALWTSNESKYAKKPPSLDTLSKKLSEAQNKVIKYGEAELRVKAHKEKKAAIEAQIAALQVELATAENGIAAGETWLEQNKDYKTASTDIQEQYNAAAKNLEAYNAWQKVKAQKADLDEFETISQKADAKEKSLLKEKQEILWEVIPNLRGVELILEDGYDEEGNQVKAGFYYNGMTSRQLSFSEWFGLVVQIMKKNKVQILVIDDAATLGSKFMETLESLSKAGCYILITEMQRGKTELQINYGN